ncbi:MAG TPA: diguanylate cyclase [Gemmatimonadales bacterium]|nr:diguanylate cyclase [Gemmatimonadales bacterium]
MAADRPFDLDRFFDLAIDMLCIADHEGYFRRVNRSFTRVLGYDQDELLARPFVELVHPDDRMETLAETRRLSTGELTLAFENRYRHKDGSYRLLSWTCYPDPETGLLYAVARDVTEERRRQTEVDGITGVANRHVWEEALAEELRRAGRLRVAVSIGMFDVDHLRAYNEAMGHLEGDKRLREIATAMVNHLRRSGDLVGRWEGGTFGVLIGGAPDLSRATAHCDRLRHAVEDLDLGFDTPAGRRTLTLSGGVMTRTPYRGDDPNELVQAALRALANAKAAGRNHVLPAVD